jgi:hypothetical protein
MKPTWLTEMERSRDAHRRLKRCINCRHVGEPAGLTNPIKGVGRATMYRCALHPESPLIYFDSLACTDYEFGPTGAK